MARKAGQKLAKLTVSEVEIKSNSIPLPMIRGGVTGAALLGTMALLLLLRQKK
jgi:hypothetical protein